MRAGEIAPNFILKDERGNDFELYAHLDKKILLAFYPKDDTPVCSTQLGDYNKNLDDFLKIGINIIGINIDSVESHLLFSEKLKLKFPLLADVDKKISKIYGALNLFNMNKRMIVLIDNNKKIVWVESTFPFTYLNSEEILKKVKLFYSKEMT